MHETLIPPIQFTQGYLLTLVAVIGTTIAPWMQFYQQSAITDKQINIADLRYERIDTYVLQKAGEDRIAIRLFLMAQWHKQVLYATLRDEERWCY